MAEQELALVVREFVALQRTAGAATAGVTVGATSGHYRRGDLVTLWVSALILPDATARAISTGAPSWAAPPAVMRGKTFLGRDFELQVSGNLYIFGGVAGTDYIEITYPATT